MKIFFFFILLTTHALAQFDHLNLVNGCRVFRMDGTIHKTYPGVMCLFLDDGRLISATNDHMRMYGRSNEVLWEITGHFHHQMNFSVDKKTVLTISSELTQVGKEKGRIDTLVMISLEGKILRQRSIHGLLKEKKLPELHLPINFYLPKNLQSKIEFSHFNSIYEIPPLKTTKAPAFIKPGNIIVNGMEHGIFILSPDLGQLIHHLPLKLPHHWVHDVQVRTNGNILLYNNFPPEATVDLKYSAIQEIDPRTEKTIFEFTAEPKTMFYSWMMGNVQELSDDVLLFTHVVNGTYIYSRSKKKMLMTVLGTHSSFSYVNPSQDTKALDLRSFFKNRL